MIPGNGNSSSYTAAAIYLSFTFEKQEVYMLLELVPLEDQQTLKDGIMFLQAWKKEFIKLNGK